MIRGDLDDIARDAARYRALRSLWDGWKHIHLPTALRSSRNLAQLNEPVSPESLDAEIDALLRGASDSERAPK